MPVHTTNAFRSAVLKQLTFTAIPQENHLLYQNVSRPELGYYRYYTRPGYYDFSIADFTVPHNFKVSFDNPNKIIRFGNVYQGDSIFRLHNQAISTFSPSTFFVIEKALKGEQIWKQGQHFRGAEITIYDAYLSEILCPLLPNLIPFEDVRCNYTYRYLPLGIVAILEQMQRLSTSGDLTPLYLESKILECIAILTNEIMAPDSSLAKRFASEEITIGKDHKIRLTYTDVQALQKAHDILTEHYTNPPTIENLSSIVLLNPQKLKAGFSHHYHMSIGEYTSGLRMNTAVTLLTTTNLSIEEIAHKVGYHYCPNFVNKFKKVYGITPLSFRKSNRAPAP